MSATKKRLQRYTCYDVIFMVKCAKVMHVFHHRTFIYKIILYSVTYLSFVILHFSFIGVHERVVAKAFWPSHIHEYQDERWPDHETKTTCNRTMNYRSFRKENTNNFVGPNTQTPLARPGGLGIRQKGKGKGESSDARAPKDRLPLTD